MKDSVQVIRSEEVVWFPAAFINGKIYVFSKEVGLFELANDKLTLLDDASYFGTDLPYAILSYPDSSSDLILATQNHGFFKFDGSEIKPLELDINEYAISNHLRDALFYEDKYLITGTLNDGIMVLNLANNSKRIINESSGLSDHSILSIELDQQGGFWCTSNTGLSRIEEPAPITFFSSEHGLSGITTSLFGYHDDLYVGTTEGVFKLETDFKTHCGRFTALPEINSQTYSFYQMSGGKVLACTSDGLYSIENDVGNNIFPRLVRWVIEDTFGNLIAATRQGLELLQMYNRTYHSIDTLLYLSENSVSKIVLGNNKNYWLRTYGNTVIRVHLPADNTSKPEVTSFDTTNGLPCGWVVPYKLNGEIVFATSEGLYIFDSSNNFIPYSSFGSYFAGGGIEVSYIGSDKNGQIWIASEGRFGKLIKKNAAFHWDNTVSLRIPKSSIWAIYHDNQDVTWVGTTDALYRLDGRIQPIGIDQFSTLIRKVSLGNDSLLFAGTQGDHVLNKPTLLYADNSIAFKYTCTFLTSEEKNSYQHWLEGYDDSWSEWQYEAERYYTNLAEGEYIFNVKSKNVYDKVSNVASYAFIILPPWYRTTAAYLGYIFGAVLFVLLVVKLNSRRLVAANIKLQRLINHATIEIRGQKEEIEKNRDEIQSKNVKITKSIKYAKRIQDAILPEDEFIAKGLPEHFIFFKPRDIVSGDFYWFTIKGDLIIMVVADCTGHGVPGAFVSMIGNTMLNKIVNEKDVTTPGKILHEMNLEIRYALKQDDELNEIKDGMDMSVCIFHNSNNILEFAGAYSSIYHVTGKPQRLSEYKGNNYPVAGYHTVTDRKYDTKEIETTKGDMIYSFTDGFADQFGGPDNRKFSLKRFRDLLVEISSLSVDNQYQELESRLNAWKGEDGQLDDILVIGIRV
ncbi:MAG: SpoIIE family protein phosphatase [Bacteroidetes bacterium]|nr:SpoIIE family protein phosphatase [Bacteroidota bacterium]